MSSSADLTTIVFAPASSRLLLLGNISICVILSIIIVQLLRATCGSRFLLSSGGRGRNWVFRI